MEQIKRDTLTLADRLNRDFAKLELADRIERIGGLAYRAVFTTCMGMGDQVLSRAIALSGQSIVQATSKSSLLQPQNRSLLQITRDRYAVEIKEYDDLFAVLKGADVWIVVTPLDGAGQGLSPRFAEWDSARGVLRINPLADWSKEKIRAAIAAHEIPANPANVNQQSIEALVEQSASSRQVVEYPDKWWRKQRQGQVVNLRPGQAELQLTRQRETCLVP